MPRHKNPKKIARGLARGLNGADALRQAGYAESTIDKKGYRIIRQPQVQSFLTEALEALGVTAKQILQPIKDGLEACEVVKTDDGTILTDHPDHKVRFMAHDRAVVLYGLTAKHSDHLPTEPPQPAPPVSFNIVFVAPPKRDPQLPMPDVSFVKPGPR